MKYGLGPKKNEKSLGLSFEGLSTMNEPEVESSKKRPRDWKLVEKQGKRVCGSGEPTIEEIKSKVQLLASCLDPLESALEKVTQVSGVLTQDLSSSLKVLGQISKEAISEHKSYIIQTIDFYRYLLNHPVISNLGYFGMISTELVQYIFGFLNCKDLLIVAQVCKPFQTASEDDLLWKTLVLRGDDLPNFTPNLLVISDTLVITRFRSWKWIFKAEARVFRLTERREGVGAFWRKGFVYNGEWKRGNLHGFGSVVRSGSIRIGQWVNGVQSGPGVYKWTKNQHNDGGFYCGEFKNDQYHGKGMYRSSRGEYKGEFEAGNKHGKGVWTLNCGALYDGEFVGGLPHGQGIFRHPNSDQYIGEWANRVPAGLGTVKCDGQVVTRDWAPGELYISPQGCKIIQQTGES